MTNPTITPYSPASLDPHSRETANHRRKLLIFQVGKLNLALPVEFVKKILHYMPMEGSGTTAVGLIHLGDQEITAIDLHKRLFKVSQTQIEGRQFLILAKNTIDEQFGILISQTPSLIDLPLSQIRTLPDSYRRADTLDMASHVTRVQHMEQLLTVFVLDVDRLVPPIGIGDFVF
ncbi:chemotaxis protein CheW [Crocosphaera sp. XPORK-15E]|uniref:chemotaxis protein CheW n=1 Tax=Crocosphaera sp. XPORK-15E TaxID=3110247 RepID=UPI002B203D59|nr:chemotaxis protein CheW [Crocosphaera sp. XPORK-15E]MEA5536285.1 chemotaxis protein CheW [Crocosphaera sp. XPORK-15E]